MSTWDWDYAWEILPALLEGLWATVAATLVGIVIAMVLGLVVAVALRSDVKPVTWPLRAVVELIRRTPLLVQLYFLFYVLPAYDIVLTPFVAGVIGLGLHYSTYTSEVYRAGIESVPKGQWEASVALDLSRRTTWTSVVLPQAVPRVIPALGNYLIAMFKDATLLFAITYIGLMATVRTEAAQSFRVLEGYTLAGVLFLAVSIPCAVLVRHLEVRLARDPA